MTLTVPYDGSFPSSHAAAAFGLAASIWRHNKKLGLKFLIMAILVGIGRVVGNVHNLVDVLAGAFIGLAASVAIERLHPYKIRK